MNWKLPNQLTVARMLLAVVFFVLLGIYQQGTQAGRWVLNAAFVIYIVAGITDVLDGHLARKWNIVSAFGRIVDPFVDKVLVVGSFIMLTGGNYAMTEQAGPEVPHWLTGGMASAVQAWMVVVILCREFIVSAVRGYAESQGIKFPATCAGKIKMLVQSVAICTILYQMANLPATPWAVWLKVVMVWAAVIVTIFSGFAYISNIRRALVGSNEE